MTTALDIGTLLGTPSSAQLVIDEGQIVLVVAQREHRWKMSVEGHELGAVVHISDLLQTLDTLGLLLKSEPVQPTAAAPVEPEIPCPDCDRSFRNTHGLSVHCARFHKPTPPAALPEQPVVAAMPVVVPAVDDDTPSLPPPLRMPDGVRGHTATERCAVCNRLWRLHETCKSCDAAIGDGHDDRGVNGDCTNCYVTASKKAA